MTDGTPSLTARRVAAYRLGFDRLEVPYGDPGGDDALARSVAGPDAGDDSEAMARYLRGRTAFFDRVVTGAIARQVTQAVSVGAGYDGRSIRYAKPGVRWWEVDHPDTQADKRERLERLGIDAAHVGFVAHDLRRPGLAKALVAAGYQPDAASIVICEGVAVYLDLAVLEAVLAELRSLATVGTRLAISLSAPISSPERASSRERFETAVAAMGESAKNCLSATEAEGLLTATRWQAVEISERASNAGFVLTAPVWAPSSAVAPKTVGQVGDFMDRMLHRAGADGIGSHIESTYGTAVKRTKELDLGVHLVEFADGARWVARVFPATREPEAAQSDAEVLDWLASIAFPAEVCADSQPVSVHCGQAVLVTRLAPGRVVAARPATFESLGRLLAGLHSTADGPPAARRPGGSWHHLILDAGVAEEIDSLRSLWHAARHRVATADRHLYDSMAEDLNRAEDFADLPHAFGHADLVPRNLIASTEGNLTVIDWTGAGWFPRISALGCLIWSAGQKPAWIQAAIAGYRSSITLEPVEIDRLASAMRARPLVLACWSFVTGRRPLADAVAYWEGQRSAISQAAVHAVSALEA